MTLRYLPPEKRAYSNEENGHEKAEKKSVARRRLHVGINARLAVDEILSRRRRPA